MKDSHIEQIVAEWDSVYKRGQLSLWVLLSLVDGRKYAGEINLYMDAATHGRFGVQEQSLYRALRRFEHMRIVEASLEDSPASGAKRKYYALTPAGHEILRRFVAMNISPLISPPVVDMLKTLSTSERMQHE